MLIRISVYYAKNSCKVNEQKPEKCLPNVIILSKISAEEMEAISTGKLTVAEVAKRVGIDKAEDYISLEGLSDEEKQETTSSNETEVITDYSKLKDILHYI